MTARPARLAVSFRIGRAFRSASRPKMAEIMIDSVDRNPAPKRIRLGSDSYTAIHKALTERLAAFEAQKDLAFSTDLPANA